MTRRPLLSTLTLGMVLAVSGYVLPVSARDASAATLSSAGRAAGPVTPSARMRAASLVGTQTTELPVAPCETFNANYGTGIPRGLSPWMSVPVATNLIDQLTVYAGGPMRLLGPRGWQCYATVGSDGQGGLSIFPPDAPLRSNYPIGVAWKAQAIVGHETASSADPTLEQACRLFPVAVAEFRKYNDFPDDEVVCQPNPPPGEQVIRFSGGIVAFLDPAGVRGDGYPSGGPYPANGVMTYYPTRGGSSWVETCTLPASEKALCTAILNSFIQLYGNQ